MDEHDGLEVNLLRGPPDLRLDGRVAWVTGASRGLGRAIALALAGVGASVVLSARDAERLGEIVRIIEGAGGNARAVPGSVTDPQHVSEAAAAVDREWGRLDILINNAGVGATGRRAEAIDAAEWHRTLDVNLTAPFACCQAALPLLERSDGGAVVNVSSIHGSVGLQRQAAYSASKGGVELLTRALAVEWAPRGIRVNAVAPGYLETDMTRELLAHPRLRDGLINNIPLGRFGTVSDVVAAVLFLSSPWSSYTTGSTVFVDGGWTAR
jgi:NAD(P)-dependent dehydrogenase (short-subunit alcohol dehydrogenase family)